MSQPPTEEEIKQEIQKEHEIERNKREAVSLAGKIFEMATSTVMLKETPDARHAMFCKRYESFARAFPLVLSKMTKDSVYNEKAFKRFLDKLHKDPGKGMDGIIERQADYAMFLYEEDSKERGRHFSKKVAGKIWNLEYKQMNAWVKSIKEKEKEFTNEFEEESKTGLDARKDELLQWVNAEVASSGPTGEIDGAVGDVVDVGEIMAKLSTAREKEDNSHPELKQAMKGKYVEKYNRPVQPESVEQAVAARTQLAQDARRSEFLQDTNIPSWKSKTGKK